MYGHSRGEGSLEPLLGLVFENGKDGEKIFRGWRHKLGESDENERLSISIVTGIDRAVPSDYIVAISEDWNLKGMKEGRIKRISIMTRYMRMTSASLQNMQWFLLDYERSGAYFILPAKLEGGRQPFIFDLRIRKKKLRVIEAWKIDEYDPLTICVGEIVNPVIPEGMTDPPIIRTRKLLKDRER